MRRSWFFAAVTILSLSCLIAGIVAWTDHRSSAAPAEPIIAAPGIPEPVEPQAQPSTDPVLDLFNPSETALSEQLNASTLKNRLEELMVLAFVLRRCEYLSQQEYAATFQAMGTYVQRMQPGDPQQWQQSITAAVDSASASYALLYARTKCDDPAHAANAAALAQWRAEINPPPQ